MHQMVYAFDRRVTPLAWHHGARQLLIVRCDSPEDTDKIAATEATRLCQTAVNQTGGNCQQTVLKYPQADGTALVLSRSTLQPKGVRPVAVARTSASLLLHR